MNIVENETKKEQPLEFSLSNLTEGNQGEETAFIGKCGDGPENSLYLINYKSICLASNPVRTWTHERCRVWIKEFVDIKITITKTRSAASLII